MSNAGGRTGRACSLLGIALAAAVSGSAFAQEYVQDLLARDAGREYGRVIDVVRRFERADRLEGRSVGAFRIQPTLSAGMAYDDNIFVSQSGRRSDGIGIGKAGMTAVSTFSRHSLELSSNLEGGAYISNSNQNYWLARTGANGRLDITNDASLDGQLFYGRLIEPRDSPDGVGGLKPTVFHIYVASGGLNYAFGRFRLSGRGGFVRLRYEDVQGSTGTIDTVDRDFDEISAEGQIAYTYLASEQIYVRVRVGDRNYRLPVSFDRFDRDFRSVTALGGATFDLGGLIAGEVRGGFQRYDIDDSRLGTVDSPIGDLTLSWNPTRDTTVTGFAGYDFVPSFADVSPGFRRIRASLRVAHDFSASVLALGRFIYEDRDYDRSTRREQLYGVDVGLIYRVDRGLYLEGQYLFRIQEGEGGSGGYRRNIVLLQARRVF